MIHDCFRLSRPAADEDSIHGVVGILVQARLALAAGHGSPELLQNDRLLLRGHVPCATDVHGMVTAGGWSFVPSAGAELSIRETEVLAPAKMPEFFCRETCGLVDHPQ